MREEVERWMNLAKDDLASADVILHTKKYYVSIFLCQQSVEKGLKAILIHKTGSLLKIHDLVLLGKKVGIPPHLLKKCERLSAVYLDTRYGDIGGKLPSEKFNETLALEFLAISQEVVTWVEKSILTT